MDNGMKYLETLGITELRPWENTSPSQLSTYRQCPRKWWLEKIGGLRQPSTPAQKRGTAKHAHLEAYLRGEAPLTDPVCAAGLQYLPDPGDVLPEDVERKFIFEDPNLPVPCRGVIDLVERLPRITDHKTTSGMQYIKTPEELAGDPQAVLYTCYATRDLFKDPNMDLRFRLIYYLTRGSPQSAEVEITMTKAMRARGFVAIMTTSIEMEKASRVTDPREIEGNSGACANYGGCPHRMMCARMGTSSMGDLSGLLRPRKESRGMSKFKDLMEKKKREVEAAAGGSPVPAPEPTPETSPEPVESPDEAKRRAQAEEARKAAEADKGGVVPPDAPSATATPAPETEAAPAPATTPSPEEAFPFGVPPMDDGVFMESMRQGGYKTVRKPVLVNMAQRACSIAGAAYPADVPKPTKGDLIQLLQSCLESPVGDAQSSGTEATKSEGAGDTVTADRAPSLSPTPPRTAEEFEDWLVDGGHLQDGLKRRALVDVVMLIDTNRPEGSAVLCEDPDEEDKNGLLELINGYVEMLPEAVEIPEGAALVTWVRARMFQALVRRRDMVRVVKAICALEKTASPLDMDKALPDEILEALENSAAHFDQRAEADYEKTTTPAAATPEEKPEAKPGTLRVLKTLYIGCMPRKRSPDEPDLCFLDEILIPFQEKVADDAQLPWYGLVEFNEGARRVAALVRQSLREGSLELPVRLFANRRNPCADAVIETLSDHVDSIIERV